jgi:hypothetical protein
MTYAEWAGWHATAFGFQTEAEGKMLLSWTGLFRDLGITPGELAAASKDLAARDPPIWRSEHLQALRDRVRQLRNPPPPRPPDEPAPGDCGTCRDCGGTGRVIVPAGGVKTANGNAVSRPGSTAAVTCRCALGRWFADRPGDRPALLSLEAYERWNPDWRRQVDAERHAGRLRAEAAGLDRSLGKVLAGIGRGG